MGRGGERYSRKNAASLSMRSTTSNGKDTKDRPLTDTKTIRLLAQYSPPSTPTRVPYAKEGPQNDHLALTDKKPGTYLALHDGKQLARRKTAQTQTILYAFFVNQYTWGCAPQRRRNAAPLGHSKDTQKKNRRYTIHPSTPPPPPPRARPTLCLKKSSNTNSATCS